MRRMEHMAGAGHAAFLDALGVTRLRRFRADGDGGHLDGAVSAAERAIAATPPGHRKLAAYYSNLAVALSTRFNDAGSAADLDAAIDAGRQAIAGTPPGDPARAGRLALVYSMLCVRYARAEGDGADLDAVIDAGRMALAAAPPADPSRAVELAELAVCLYRRFGRSSDGADLDAAIEAMGTAVVTVSPGDPELVSYLADLAIFRHLRFCRAGNAADVAASLEAAQKARELDPSQPGPRSAYADARYAQFTCTGQLADLEAAVLAARQAVTLSPPGHPGLPQCLSNLGRLLRERFRLRGEDADLDAAVDCGQRAVELARLEGPDLAGCLSGLASSLRNRFERSGSGADLTAAVDAGQRAVTLTPPGSPNYAGYLSNLGLLLGHRFDLTGEPADLDDAISAGREAVDLTPPGGLSAPDLLSNLGSALMQRFLLAGERSDLDAAIDFKQQALALTAPGDPARARYLSNLGTSLRARFESTGKGADLDAAVDAGQQAVALCLAGSPHLGRYLLNLCSTLRTRYLLAGNDEDLDAAVAAGRRAVALLPPAHASRGDALGVLAIALYSRYERSAVLDDLDGVIETGRQAVAVTAPDDPNRASYLSNLGLYFLARFRRTGQNPDLDAAVGYLQQATELRTGIPESRLVAARAWGRAAVSAGRVSEAAQGFAAAVGVLPELVWHGLARATKAEQLSQLAGLAADAAACAVLDGRPQDAIEILEQGRSVLWTQALHLRSDLSRLEEKAPDLARRLDSIRRVLDASAAKPEVDQASGIESRRRLARAWDTTLARVRTMAGFGHFLTATPYGELAAAGGAGPVVIVNASVYGCHALIIDGTTAGPRVVDLPGMSLDGAIERSATLADALHGRLRPGRTSQAVFDVLGWLWDVVAEPVLSELGMLQAAPPDGPRPRLWWCPTGPLTQLPIHVAGRYQGPGDLTGSDCRVPRHVISSYTPSLAALIRARRQPEPAAARYLSVGVSAAPGWPALPAVPVEMEVLARYFPPGPDSRQLNESEATCGAVLAALCTCSWVHLACHASQREADPDVSGLALWDGQLTISDLSGQPDAHRELAFLSACETAAGSPRHLDEAIHLGAAMQFSGYRHVIATLWSIADAPSPQVADRVYALIAGAAGPDSSRAAEALQDAVDDLRLRNPGDPLLWAPYLHLGP
jgi:tetratricopeptide (TPR) repeat protein